MVSFRTFGVAVSLCICSLIFLTAATSPLDSSPEHSLEDLDPNLESRSPPKVKIVYPVRDRTTRGPTIFPPVESCAGYHRVCRLHGPKARKCCGEGKQLFCKIGYGEFFCMERWESTA